MWFPLLGLRAHLMLQGRKVHPPAPQGQQVMPVVVRAPGRAHAVIATGGALAKCGVPGLNNFLEGRQRLAIGAKPFPLEDRARRGVWMSLIEGYKSGTANLPACGFERLDGEALRP